MSEKTVAELWAVAKLIRDGASFEEFPDGVTFADLERAEPIAARVNFESEFEEYANVR